MKKIDWTEAHKREAWARVLEIEARNARDGKFTSMIPIIDGWDRFRFALSCSGMTQKRIEREVRRVDGLATGRLVRTTKTTVTGREAIRCDGCRGPIAENAPRWRRSSDACEFCEGCKRDACEQAAEDGDTVTRVRAIRRTIRRIRRKR